jgi:hypothetical protein
LDVALIFSQSMRRLQELPLGQKDEEVGAYDEHELGRKTSRRTDDVVDGGELRRDGGESGMKEDGFGGVESHGGWEEGKTCGSISTGRTSSALDIEPSAALIRFLSPFGA